MLGNCLGSTTLLVAAVLAFVTMARLNAVSGMSIIGWTGVSLVSERRVIGAQTLVDLTAANTRQCLRMCWLFRACSALTFTFKQQRCELFVLSSLTDPGAYRLAVDREGQSADMRAARMDSSLITLRGCDTRPCSETEFCATVRYYAVYTCIKLASQFCHGEPPNVPHSETERDNVGSVVYSCAQGYFQTGSNHVSECNRASGSWSSVDTTCTLVNCGTPPSVHGALSSGSGTTLGSSVTYTCLHGAIPTSAVMTSTCQGSQGRWSPMPEPCVFASCGDPPSVANMNVRVLTDRSLTGAFPGVTLAELATAYGGEAVYSCGEGYTSPAATTYISKCQEDGTWSPTDNFRCFPVDCGQPPPVANSSPTTYAVTTFGQNVTVTCLSGFSPLEGITLVCNATGHWKGPGLSCEAVDCGQPPQVDLAMPRILTTTAGSVVNYTCMTGAAPSSDVMMTSTCEASSRQWSSITSHCSVVYCQDNPALDLLDFTVTERSLVGAAPGLTDDSLPRAYGAERVYTCKDGYKAPVGSDTYISECRADGTWSSTLLFDCDPVDCGQPPRVANSSDRNYTATTFGQTIRVECLPGFSPLDGVPFTCNATGDWEGPEMTCEIIDCGAPPQVTLATIDFNETSDTISTTVDSVVNYTCLVGAAPTSSVMSSTCQVSSSQWFPVPGACTVVTCFDLPTSRTLDVKITTRPRDGAVPWLNDVILGISYGGEAVYTCKDGYKALVGSGTYISECQADGTWSLTANQLLQLCGPVDCGQPPSVANSTDRNYTTTTFGQTIRVECLPGFSPLDGIPVTCNATGDWEVPEVTCEIIDCGTPPKMDNATVEFKETFVNSTAKYICEQPALVEDEDNSTALCQENGEWSPVAVTCLTVPCGPAPELRNASLMYGNIRGYFTATYKCDSGFELGTYSGITCRQQGDGSYYWTKLLVECTGVSCPAPPDVSYANVTLTGTAYPYSAVYTCIPGFYLSTNDSAKTCNADATWSTEAIICTEIRCSLPGISNNAYFTTPYTADDSFSIGEDIGFECYGDFTMVPMNSSLNVTTTSSLTCQDGNWSAPNPEVFCVLKICGVPQSIPHASWAVAAAGSAFIATYKCFEGYILHVPISTNAAIPSTLTTAVSHLEVECNSLSGWPVSEQVLRGCQEVECPEILIQTDVPVEVANDHPTKFGSRVEVTCTPPLYVNSPNNIMECQADGRWSEVDPLDLCAPCNQSVHGSGIPNGVLRVDEMSGSPADRASFSCVEDFQAVGAPADQLRCGSVNGTATWLGLESAKCLQTRWESPDPIQRNPTRYVAPVDNAAVTESLKACATTTFEGDDMMVFALTRHSQRQSKAYEPVVRIEFLKDVNMLTFEQNLAAEGTSMTEKTQDVNLIEINQTAEFCIELNLIRRLYEFTKNGMAVAEMEMQRYDFSRFTIKHNVSVSLISLKYDSNEISNLTIEPRTG